MGGGDNYIEINEKTNSWEDKVGTGVKRAVEIFKGEGGIIEFINFYS